jgi:translation elongation factor EF-G
MSSGDRLKFEQALKDLAQQDPTLRITSLPTDGQTVISGMGELHLEVVCDRISREYGIKLHVGEPKVIYLEAVREANRVLLEPVMSIEVLTPEEFAGSIMGDLNSRRGRIEGMEHPAGSLVIKALVPLAEMLGYSTDIRSNTRGRASFSAHFAAYEVAPHTGESGAEEAGVTANKPRHPKTGTGFAAASLDAESE